MTDQSLSAWLALREGPDAAARSVAVTSAVRERLAQNAVLNVLDLGAGTGSNLRYLAPRLPVHQRWLLVDRDQRLLDEAAARAPTLSAPLNCAVSTRCLDLNDLGPDDLFAGRQLITASALLDLVSERWLTRLAARCRAVNAVALMALTYTGESHCVPAEPEDDHVRQLLNRHQHNDKGLGGPAAGPDAVRCAERCFEALHFTVMRERSDWKLGSGHRELQKELIDGWAHAAVELEPAGKAAILDWLERRHAHIDGGRSQIVVTHEDLAAWPALLDRSSATARVP